LAASLALAACSAPKFYQYIDPAEGAEISASVGDSMFLVERTNVARDREQRERNVENPWYDFVQVWYRGLTDSGNLLLDRSEWHSGQGYSIVHQAETGPSDSRGAPRSLAIPVIDARELSGHRPPGEPTTVEVALSDDGVFEIDGVRGLVLSATRDRLLFRLLHAAE